MGDGVAQASACVVSGGVRGGVFGRGERRLCRLGVEDVGDGVERVRDERDAAGHVVGCGDGVRGWFGFGDVAGVDAQSGAVVEFGDEDDAPVLRGLERGGLVSGEDALAVADGVVRPVSGDPWHGCPFS